MRRAAWMGLLLAAGCTGRDTGAIAGQGTIEVEETDVVSTVEGRVSRFRVREGATVRAGDTVATLVSSTLPDDLHEREARVARAEAELRDLERGSRPEEISRAEADLRGAAAEDARAARDRERMEALGQTDAVSQQEVDQARSVAAQAHERREAARETLDLLRAGATREAVQAARSRLAEARAALAQGQATRGELTLVAPVGGVVLPQFYRVGELVAEGKPVLTIADVSHPWVRVYLNQKDLPAVTVGGPAEAKLDGAPGQPIAGRVVAINHQAEYTPRVALTLEERADLVFGVKVALDDVGRMARAGLPVTVRFGTSPAAGAQVVAEARP
jgi:membrane fusion protein YbhG